MKFLRTKVREEFGAEMAKGDSQVVGILIQVKFKSRMLHSEWIKKYL
jgi:hypothetical protein